jgi:hypothetical protein
VRAPHDFRASRRRGQQKMNPLIANNTLRFHAPLRPALTVHGWLTTRKQSPTYDLARQLGGEPDQLQLKGQH